MRWWRVFVDRVTRRPHDEAAAVGPRRRQEARFPLRTRVTAKCVSWRAFSEHYTTEVSAGGLALATRDGAQIGEGIELAVALPNGNYLPVRGIVVGVRPEEISVKLEGLDAAQTEKWESLVATAQAGVPAPETASQPAQATATGSKPGTGSGPRGGSGPLPGDLDKTVPRAVKRVPVGAIVGIDLGTSYTSVAAIRGTRVVILAREDGLKSVPSVVSFPSKNEILVGAPARERLVLDPAHTIVSPKRLLGRRYDEREIQPFLAQAAYRTHAGPNQTVVAEMWDQQVAITQVCAYLLAEARDLAEQALGEPILRAVLTVPVSFAAPRIEQLKRAARLAQLDVVATIDEPSAAALANRFVPGFGGVVGVYDLGGGTFDFSVVDVSKGDFVVLATAGDTWLGGDDFDLALAEDVANRIWRDHSVELRRNAERWQRLLFSCEAAKRTLTTCELAVVAIEDAFRTAAGPAAARYEIDRPTLSRLSAPIIDRSLQTCDEALGRLGMKPGDLTAVYLSGGTTHIPAVREAIERHFGVPVRSGVPVEHAVCLGAGIHAAQLQVDRDPTLDARA